MRSRTLSSPQASRVASWIRHWRAWAPDVLGLTWVLGAAGVVLAPALIHGTAIRNPGTYIDQVTYGIPLTNLAWTQVHHGQLPLWNPYNATGLPLAFTWNSAPFSIPALIGYLFPLRLAYIVQAVVPVFVA